MYICCFSNWHAIKARRGFHWRYGIQLWLSEEYSSKWKVVVVFSFYQPAALHVWPAGPKIALHLLYLFVCLFVGLFECLHLRMLPSDWLQYYMEKGLLHGSVDLWPYAIMCLIRQYNWLSYLRLGNSFLKTSLIRLDRYVLLTYQRIATYSAYVCTYIHTYLHVTILKSITNPLSYTANVCQWYLHRFWLIWAISWKQLVFHSNMVRVVLILSVYSDFCSMTISVS